MKRAWTRALSIASPVVCVALLGAAPARAQSCRMCDVGRNQSPVRLIGLLDAPQAPGPSIDYRAQEPVRMEHKGDNLKGTLVAGGSALLFDATRYTLTDFHFHAPGEHWLADGTRGVMELHLVHSGPGGALAVVGVPIFPGAVTHTQLAELLRVIPQPGQPQTINANLRPLAFHPRRVLTYAGSLTTDDCDEGVLWFVYDARDLVRVSSNDLGRYRAAFPADYARDPQPLRARRVVRVGAVRQVASAP